MPTASRCQAMVAGPASSPLRASAEVHDPLDHIRVDRRGRSVRSPATGLERPLALQPPTAKQSGHERLRHPVTASRLRLGQAPRP
jgi:hypothetical protein